MLLCLSEMKNKQNKKGESNMQTLEHILFRDNEPTFGLCLEDEMTRCGQVVATCSSSSNNK